MGLLPGLGTATPATFPSPDTEGRYETLAFSIDGSRLSAMRRIAVASGAVELMRCSPQPGSSRFLVQMIVLMPGLAAAMKSIGAFAAEDGQLLQDLSCSCGKHH